MVSWQGNIPKKSSYEGFRTDSSANCRLRAGLSTLVGLKPFYMSLSDVVVRSITHRSQQMYFPETGIPFASLRVSLTVANTITAERRAFTAGFQAVLEDERKSLVLRLVVRTLYFGAFVLIY